ncbi:chemotaxis protein CheW [Undibacterium terreum]|uniref:Chemotaxis protein W n=1 Tax=Undibacterium terreum TaxID=1224302 RepID=A0A916XN65_9BURK|nr:chemotaxis protein CheW [Undibacterium terreum]GGC84805.1 chemotaxis protein W [Undibacterium terreum]
MEVLETPASATAMPPADASDEQFAEAARLAAAKKQAPPVNAAGSELFGSFLLGRDEFSLPASCIREVVNYPEKMSTLPLSPPFLEGMFTLRGTVIPVINLARLFKPDADASNPSQVIAIIDFEQVLVGILFDTTGEILRVRPEQRSTLYYEGENVHGVIAGTILLAGGSRLLQILDASALIHIENVPQVLALRAANQKQSDLHFKTQNARRQCVSFHVGASSFAFEMEAIQEIIRVPELQPSILNSKLCLGRINFRGTQVGVVDFSTLLNAPRAEQQATPDQRIVLARIGDASVGFLVDSVDSIISFFSSELLPIPLLSKARAGMFGGCISQPGVGEIIFLNHHEIFSRTEIVEMRRGHSNLYPEEEKLAGQSQGAAQGQREAKKIQRRVYISFQLENTFAVEIRQIREIIDFSDNFIRPPGMPACMLGILNLRQQMISIIDLRGLYQMPPLADTAQAKILIVERGDERYGLLVDAVEDIMTIADNNRFPTPKLARNASSTDLRSEMEEVVDIIAEDGTRRTLSVFECEAFLQRLAREMPENGQLQ